MDKITITLPAELKEQIRKYCLENDLTVSSFIRLAVRQYFSGLKETNN